MSDNSGSDVLTTLGTVHIWISLFLLPVGIVCLIVAMVLESKQQQGWKTGTATCTHSSKDCQLSGTSLPYHCKVDVTVDTLGSHVYSMTYTKDTDTVNQGETWQVAYDPKDPQGTLTQNVSTSGSRATAVTVTGVILGVCVLLFILNLVFRKNRTFKQISGVMEISNIASNLGAGFR